VRALLAFFTVLPVPASSLEDAARKAYLLPLVGLLTGLPGAALLLLAYTLPPGVSAALALPAVLLAAGLHHTDGVMDAGDALMVRGSREMRLRALKDGRAGAGAVGALLVVYAPSFAALATLTAESPARAALALLSGEVAARSAMLLLLLLGRPAEPGSSSAYFVGSLKRKGRRTAALVLALVFPPLLALPLGSSALLAAFAAPTAATFALPLARRAFGGIGGDVTGASGELARATLLVALSALV
jgi:adenosylcobinamide-GDP ribazoletransferase